MQGCEKSLCRHQALYNYQRCPSRHKLPGCARSLAARSWAPGLVASPTSLYLTSRRPFPICSMIGMSESNGDVTEAGKYCIRPAEKREAKLVAELMAKTFHMPSAVHCLEGAAFNVFQAEVLNSMIAKLNLGQSNRFKCLVAESQDEDLYGVVEVSNQEDPQVLKLLDFEGIESTSYVYISGMAVREDLRRQGIGTTLLKAAELEAEEWGDLPRVLHVHTDNESGIDFYTRSGYTEIFREGAFPMRRPRVMLVKK